MVCAHCHETLPTDGDYVYCGKCDQSFHFECSGVKKTTWKGKSVKHKNEWECQKCRGKKTRSHSTDEDPHLEEPAFQALKKLIENMFHRQEKIIADRVDNIMAVVTQLEEKFLNNIEMMKQLEEKSIKMEKDIENLKLSIEREKQYSRSRNFVITSIPLTEKEDVKEITVKLLRTMDIDINKGEFTAHRLPSKKSPSPIIVQCNNRDTRDSIVRRARKHRPKLSLISTAQPDRNIYFNDHITPYFSSLMAKANEIKTNKGYRYIWMNGDKIMVRKDNMSKAIQVIKHDDLALII